MSVCNKENDNLAVSEEMNSISITESVPNLQDKHKCLQDVKKFHFMRTKSMEKKQKNGQIEKLSSILENNGESYETFCDAQGLFKNPTKTKSNFYEEKAKGHSPKYGQTMKNKKKGGEQFLNVYKKLKIIALKLREQLQFRNINQANKNHLRVIHDRSQYFYSRNKSMESDDENSNSFSLILKFLQRFVKYSLFKPASKLIPYNCLKEFPVFNPGQKIKIFWDFIIFLVNLLLLFIFPIEISFNVSFKYVSSADNPAELQKSMELTLIFIYMFDVLIKLNTGFYKKGRLITNRSNIIRNYFRRKFISDTLFILQMIIYSYYQINSRTESANPFSILILFKIPDLIKFGRVAQDFLRLSNLGAAIFQLLQLAICILFFSHFMACGWHAVSFYGPKENMLIFFEIYNTSWEKRYFRYLFMTTNPGKLDPKNDSELVFGYFALLATSGSIGFLITGIHNIMRTLSKSHDTKRYSIQKINNFMNEKNIDFDLQNKVRQYINGVFDQSFDVLEAESNIINKLNNSLKEELLFKANGKLLMKTPIFKNINQSTLKKMVLIMKKLHFHPDDIIFQKGVKDNHSIFFIEDGEISIYQDEKKQTPIIQLKKGSFFGEQSFLLKQERTHSAISIGISSLYCITREDFLSILKEDKNEFEKFCYMRDEILFSQNYEPSELKCYLCESRGHILENCRRIHFVLDRVKVSTKHSFSVPSKNRTFYERKNRIKINSRCIKKKITEAHEEFFNYTFEKQEEDEICEDMESENKNIEEFHFDSMKTHKSFLDQTDEKENFRKSITPTTPEANNSQSHSSLKTPPNLNSLFEKKNEENELDKIMRDFEKIKNYCYFYPGYNVEAVLGRMEVRKKKMRRLTDRKSPKNKTNLTKKITLIENKINGNAGN